ncbi:hypothetical protein PAMP_006190 [Pampus punctatissimus]
MSVCSLSASLIGFSNTAALVKRLHVPEASVKASDHFLVRVSSLPPSGWLDESHTATEL